MSMQFIGIIVRVVATYFFFLLLTRLSGKRVITAGSMGSRERLSMATAFDLIIALVLGDIPDDIIFGDVPVAQGLVAASTLVLLHVVVSYLAVRYWRFEELVESVPTPVVERGKLGRRGMARERFTEGNLDSELRMLRVDDRGEIQDALLEPSGKLSISRHDPYKLAKRSDLDGREG